MIADIFNASVYTLGETENSASLGGAYRAKHALMPEGTTFKDAVEGALPYELAVTPRAEFHQVGILLEETFVINFCLFPIGAYLVHIKWVMHMHLPTLPTTKSIMSVSVFVGLFLPSPSLRSA